jgi:hypothetical protein
VVIYTIIPLLSAAITADADQNEVRDSAREALVCAAALVKEGDLGAHVRFFDFLKGYIGVIET